jgi:hypothetical protein
MSVLPWRLNLLLVCLLVHRVSPFTYLLFSSPSFYFFVERDRYDGELERAGRRMHELDNMANQAALEFQYLMISRSSRQWAPMILPPFPTAAPNSIDWQFT